MRGFLFRAWSAAAPVCFSVFCRRFKAEIKIRAEKSPFGRFAQSDEKRTGKLCGRRSFFTETVIPEKERGLSFLLLDSFQQINLRRLISFWGISGLGVKGLRRLGVSFDSPYRFAAFGFLIAGGIQDLMDGLNAEKRGGTVWTEGAAQRIKLFGLDNG